MPVEEGFHAAHGVLRHRPLVDQVASAGDANARHAALRHRFFLADLKCAACVVRHRLRWDVGVGGEVDRDEVRVVLDLLHRLDGGRRCRDAFGLRLGCARADRVARCGCGRWRAWQRVRREADGGLRHAVFHRELLHESGFDCDLLQPCESVGAFLGCDLLERLRALPVLVHVRGALAAYVDAELGRETPFALGCSAQSLHHRLAGEQRRRCDLAACDGVKDDRVLDRIEHLVGQHALLLGEHSVGCGEFCAHAWPFVVLRPEQHALRHADAQRDLVHEVLDESGERLRRTRRHDLDAVRVLKVSNHADLGQLVLLLLSAWQRHRRIRLEKVSRVGGAPVVENQRRLLRREADAGFLRLQNLVQHPRRLDRAVKVGDAAILVDPKWIEVVAKLIRRNVFGAEINAVPVHAENAISHRLAEVVRDDALEIVVRGDRRVVRVADARCRHELQFQTLAAAPDDETAVAVNRTFLGCELHEFLERVPVRDIAVFAPRVEILVDHAVVIPVASRR